MQELLDYINQRLIYGASREEIKRDLLNAGWQEDDVNAAIIQATEFPEAVVPKQAADDSNKKLLIAALLGILIIGSGAFGYFYYFRNRSSFLSSPTPSPASPITFLSPTLTPILTPTPYTPTSIPTLVPKTTLTATPTPIATQTTTKRLNESNIYTIEDDGTIITSGVPSDRGIVNNLINETGVINKFFREYPTAPDAYDFAIVFTNFKSPNVGHFTHAKDLDSGISDYQAVYDLSHIRQLIGYNGQSRFKGFVLVPDMYNAIDDSFWIILHELSHWWLFYFKNAGMTDANFAHYKDNISTLTKEGDIVYKDPNGGGSLTPNPSISGYCLDFGSPSKYRFTSLSLYLMGLIPPEQVIPIKQYETSGSWSDKGILCTEKTFSVQDIINIAGPRRPSYSTSQKDFSVAYILLTHKGEKPTGTDIRKMDYIANTFPVKWNEATNYKSTINGRGVIH